MRGKGRILPARTAAAGMLLALFASLFAAGCAKAPDDAAIKSGIQSKFYADPALKATNLQVVVTKGEVMLAGEVPSEELKDRAEQLAKATSGVTGVEDRIAVTPPAAPQPAPAASAAEAPPQPVRRAATRRRPRRTPAQPAQPPVRERVESAPAQTAASTPPPERASEPVRAPARVTIPSGTHISVRMIDSVDSSKNRTGQVFRASLDQPIVVDGETVVPSGADISIRLAEAKSAGRMTGSSELELQLVKLKTGGKSYPLVSNSYTAKGKSRGKDTATKVGAGAAIGAVIGAIAGGGKGAAIGAATGAGAGTAIQLATRGQQVKVPSETLLDFVLQQPVAVARD